MSKVTHAYIFANGMVMAFDEHGQQVPEYQGTIKEAIPKLERDFPNLVIGSGQWKRRQNANS